MHRPLSQTHDDRTATHTHSQLAASWWMKRHRRNQNKTHMEDTMPSLTLLCFALCLSLLSAFAFVSQSHNIPHSQLCMWVCVLAPHACCWRWALPIAMPRSFSIHNTIPSSQFDVKRCYERYYCWCTSHVAHQRISLTWKHIPAERIRNQPVTNIRMNNLQFIAGKKLNHNEFLGRPATQMTWILSRIFGI